MTATLAQLILLLASTLFVSTSKGSSEKHVDEVGEWQRIGGEVTVNKWRSFIEKQYMHTRGRVRETYGSFLNRKPVSLQTRFDQGHKKFNLKNSRPRLDFHSEWTLKFVCPLLKESCNNNIRNNNNNDYNNVCKFCTSIYLKEMPWKHKNLSKLPERRVSHNIIERSASPLFSILSYNHRKLLSQEAIQAGNKVSSQGKEEESQEKDTLRHEESATPVGEVPPFVRPTHETVNITELVELLKRDISKDPAWATLCVTFLISLLLVSMKVCGMRPINRTHEVNTDIDDDFHNVDIYEIIRIRQNYLPKRFQKLRRKWRKKWRKKLKKKEASKPLLQPSDNSEEERAIYAEKMNDF